MTVAVAEQLPEIGPQPGPQRAFLKCGADILIYGGQAGGGKTVGLLLDAARWRKIPGYRALIFRRTTKQIRELGSLWDESLNIYPLLGGIPVETRLEWTFPIGSRDSSVIRFQHMEHEVDRFNFQGAQLTFVGFDQLEGFTSRQFFYMLSRNRSPGVPVRPYVRGTANPDADSWLAEFISWWWDPETGYPIPERGGVIRYFVRDGETIRWADTGAELEEQYPHLTRVEVDGQVIRMPPKSCTFIPATVYDNKILLRENPEYLSGLMALEAVERERLLGGNWKIRGGGGMIRDDWFRTYDVPPDRQAGRCEQIVMSWDMAFKDTKDSSWVVGQVWGRKGADKFLLDQVRQRWDFPATVEAVQDLLARWVPMPNQDGTLPWPQPSIVYVEDKANGPAVISFLRSKVSGLIPVTPKDSKAARAAAVSPQIQAGNVYLPLREFCPWISGFRTEVANFHAESTGPDDQVDAMTQVLLKFQEHEGHTIRTQRWRV